MQTKRILLVVAALASVSFSQEDSHVDRTTQASDSKSVQQIVNETRDSIVVVTTEGRDGDESGMGTGFVIDSDGLIATNLHVIGEARPIWVQTRDGQRYAVTEVYASDRTLDLAIIRIDAKQTLNALTLAKEEFSEGQSAVAIGHPLGLKNSVVSGVVAGDREFGGAPMWQVSMTIEPGNSGGPLLDRQGRVQGVVSMKSMGVEAFGFAVKVAQLMKLIERPNPIAIDQWRTIGQLNPTVWQARMGARWRQRSGRLIVTGAGNGFGGRSILLRTDASPEVPFELAVSVKLDDESGAAGLVFHSDGENKHYGFYPSNRRLRITRFDGPTVYSWNVIREFESDYYHPGEWNEIKVRVEDKKITAYVNGHEAVTLNNDWRTSGRIGLCKFRQTNANFKDFRFGKKVESNSLTSEQLATITKQIESLPARTKLGDEELDTQSNNVTQRMTVLENQARALEKQAEELRQLSQDIHVAAVCKQISAITAGKPNSEIDLLSAALWIAKLDNTELDVDTYVEAVDAMAVSIRDQFHNELTEMARLKLMDDFLFRKNAFHGSRTDYYHEANSHMDRVIDDREGLPVTLSVLYIALAKRLDLNVVGVGLPGHFVVRHEPVHGEPQLIDVFDRGERLGIDDAQMIVMRFTGRPSTAEDLATTEPKDILVRMLTNLHGIAQRKGDSAAMLRYTEAIVAILPESPAWRGMRGVLRHQEGRQRAALEDLDWIIEHEPPGINLDEVRRMRDMFAR